MTLMSLQSERVQTAATDYWKMNCTESVMQTLDLITREQKYEQLSGGTLSTSGEDMQIQEGV